MSLVAGMIAVGVVAFAAGVILTSMAAVAKCSACKAVSAEERERQLDAVRSLRLAVQEQVVKSDLVAARLPDEPVSVLHVKGGHA